MIKLHFLYKAVTDLLYPEICLLCKDMTSNQSIPICISCYSGLSKFNLSNPEFNILKDRLYDLTNLKYCITIFRYQKGNSVQKLIHMLKYKSKKEVGTFFGKELANEIKKHKITFDFIVAIPMHKKKEKARGFNQTKVIANSLAEKIKVPVFDFIEKSEETESQTKKSTYQRWVNQKKKFKLKKFEHLKGKHLLIIDDVITSGATMYSCINLFENLDVTISIASVAYS